MRRAEPPKVLRCPSCGGTRLVARRRASTVEVCDQCPRPSRPTTDEYRVWWLESYDDYTLACFGADIFGRGNPAAVAQWRARLLAPAVGKLRESLSPREADSSGYQRMNSEE